MLFTNSTFACKMLFSYSIFRISNGEITYIAVRKQHFCTGNAVCRQHFLLTLLVVLAEKYYLCQPENICAKVNGFCKPLPLFKDYLQYGYYPYYMENQRDYYTTMDQVANFVIEAELPQLCGVDAGNTRKIKTLLGILATSVPFEVDISKLSALFCKVVLKNHSKDKLLDGL